MLFAALLDHRGVSNTQLQQEDAAMAELYQNKSIAGELELWRPFRLVNTELSMTHSHRSCLCSSF